MRQAWRWFGPGDPVTTRDMREAGVEAVVTALHARAPGEPWSDEEIAARQADVAHWPDGSPSGLAWEIVESLPVSEDIKRGSARAPTHVAAWVASLEALARRGVRVVCYNFMPVLDWTRTDLAWTRPSGATCLRFDLADFAAFDIVALRRPNAAEDYGPEIAEAATARACALGEDGLVALSKVVAAGLPGAAERRSLDGVRELLAAYGSLDGARLRANLVDFLSVAVLAAERLGLRLCCHSDDPPFPLLGLPRVMSTEVDYAWAFAAVELPANGMTFCAGSLGSRADNDLPGIVRRLGPRIHFLHLRSVRREPWGEGPRCSFFEDEHLEGDADMVAIVAAVLAEEARRHAEGRADADIPMRPDHGQRILDDHRRGGPLGYPLIGRMRGLAELRGVARALGDPRFAAAPPAGAGEAGPWRR